MFSVGVLVTNYDSWALALECVEAHRRLHGGELARVLLLDDCSPRPPPAALPAGLDLVRNERNLGFSANLNKGVRALGTDLVVIFDADALPLVPYLETIRKAFTEDAHLGMLGFRTVGVDGETTTSTFPEPVASSLLLGQATSLWYYQRFGEREKRWCIAAAAIVVRKAAFDEVGGFDEHFDWLDVDFDFSMAINRSRWTLRMEPTLTARHETGGTPVSTVQRVVKFYANRWQLLRKHRKIASVWPAKGIVLGRLLLELLVLLVFGWTRYGSNMSTWREKMAGRRRLIGYCWKHYT